jgi:hypothetical protein
MMLLSKTKNGPEMLTLTFHGAAETVTGSCMELALH